MKVVSFLETSEIRHETVWKQQIHIVKCQTDFANLEGCVFSYQTEYTYHYWGSLVEPTFGYLSCFLSILVHVFYRVLLLTVFRSRVNKAGMQSVYPVASSASRPQYWLAWKTCLIVHPKDTNTFSIICFSTNVANAFLSFTSTKVQCVSAEVTYTQHGFLKCTNL